MTDFRRIVRHIPDAIWDVAIWPEGQSHIYGRLDAADRKRLILTILEAAQASQEPAQDDGSPTAGGQDGNDAPDPAEARCGDCGQADLHACPSDCRVVALHDHAIEAADLAQTQGGQAGIASGLAAIAYAILATTPEDPR